MYGIPDYKLAKLDKKQFEEEWKSRVRARSDAQKRMVDMEFDMMAIPAMHAMMAQSEPMGIGFGMPCMGCTLGGGFGLFF